MDINPQPQQRYKVTQSVSKIEKVSLAARMR